MTPPPARLAAHSILAALLAAALAGCSAPSPTVVPEPAPAPTTKKSKDKPTPTVTPTPAPLAASPVGPSDQFKVTVERTPFYTYGPQQPGGPTMSIDRGSILTLLKRGFGYSQVKTKSQQTGYVATEDIVALTPEEMMAQEQPEAPPTDLGPLPRPGGVRRSVLPPSTQEDLPGLGPVPEPEPESKPDATPKSGA